MILRHSLKIGAVLAVLLALWIAVVTARTWAFYREIGREPVLTTPLRIALKEVWNRLIDPLSDFRLSRDAVLPAYHLEMTERRAAEWRDIRRKIYTRGYAREEDQVWLPGRLRWRDREFNVEFRGRGTLFTHYRADKPSFRLRFPADQTLDGTRVTNLIIPYDQARVAIDTAINALARQLDLLTYPTRFVTLTVNGEMLGVYQEVEHFREDLAVKQLRSEGFFVSGWGELKGNGTVSDHQGLAAALAELRWCVHDLCTAAQVEDLLARTLDFEKFATYAALTSLVGSAHAWGEDNLILFFDPPRGRFEPMPWDIGVDELDPENLETLKGLGAALLTVPKFRARRDAILDELIKRKTDFLLAESRRLFGDLKPALDWDTEHSRLYALRMVDYFARAVAGNAELWRSRLANRGESSAVPAPIPASVRSFSGRVELEEDLVLPIGQTALFAPGLDLRLGPGIRLVIQGDLIARGSVQQPIVVGPSDLSRPFQSLIVLGRPERKARVVLEHVAIGGGNEGPWRSAYFTGMVSLYDADLLMRSSRIHDVRGEDGLNVKFGKVDVRDSSFDDTASDAVDLDFCQGVLMGNRFSHTQGDGLDFSGSLVRAENNFFADHADKGMSVGERTVALLLGNHIARAKTGFAVKDRSWVEARGNVIDEVEIGAAVYQKKAVFGSGTLGFSGDPAPSDGLTRFLLDPEAWLAAVDEPAGGFNPRWAGRTSLEMSNLQWLAAFDDR